MSTPMNRIYALVFIAAGSIAAGLHYAYEHLKTKIFSR